MRIMGWTGVFYRASQWVSRLAYINILWIGFTLLGLIVFGFFPATAAMFAITRKWIMGKKDISIFRNFWLLYRYEFKKVNILGFIMVFIGVILYVDLTFFSISNTLLLQIIQYCLLVVSILYIIALIYFFPVYAYYNFNFMQHIKYSLLVGLRSPLFTILMVVATLCINYLVVKVPGLIPFFSGSVTSIVLILIVQPIFNRFEKENMKQVSKN